MASWLKRQKKADLETLAEESGMTGNIHELLRKDLIETLDLHLQSAPPAVRNKPSFQPYYDSLHRAESANSPVKREPAEPNTGAARASASPAPVKRARRKTITAQASDKAESAADATKQSKTKAERALAKTPQSFQKLAAQVPLPSSPQAVTNLIERSSARLTSSLSTAFERSGIPSATETTRTQLSSVQSVTALFTLLEAAALNWVLIPWRHAFNLPVPVVGSVLFGGSEVAVKFPDLFVLLTAQFWAPVTLWGAMSLFAPLLLGWLFNISAAAGGRKYKYAVDPVIFNAVKGLATWLVFVRKWKVGPEGYVHPRTAGTVDGGLLGGVAGLFVASGTGAGIGLWEGVLRGQR